MDQFKKILVPFDDNDRSIKALEYAAMFAAGIGAKITALHVADPKDYRSKQEFQASLKELINKQLQPVLNRIQKRYTQVLKIDLQVRGMNRSLDEHIVDFAVEHEIDFMILRSHGESEEEDWESVLKNTTAYQVVLNAPCPVFTFTLVPDLPQMKNLLVPVDLSEGSLYKIPLAVAIAKQFGATIHVVSASEHHDDAEDLEEMNDKLCADLRNQGVKLVKGCVISNTLPAAVLEYSAQHMIDLVLIMSRPGFRWSDLWVSPKAKRIINLSKVPVLSIRSNVPLEVSL
ncbi:MAG: universal stress protein [Cyclobacteriaceae bacterium]